MMSKSDPHAPRPFNDRNIEKMKERTPLNQVVTYKSNSMQRIVQVMHRMAQKSFISACQLFCLPLKPLSCEKVMCFPTPTDQPKEDTNTQVALRSPPSTVLILNISNSTLIDCVIGNETYPSTVTERQPLIHESKLHVHDQLRCSCSCGQQEAAQTASPPPSPPPPPLWPPPPSAEHLSVSIHSSHLNCVIIGDDNYMHAEQS
ncbi:uncharacterized protein LOC103365025 [Stegastes partitus]|uniref:Uncharacterized protein LOC103365025 n=1 Tax=Stegastes partitus TaxID=144197 RepID=A0A9Y4N9H0_9TELE|nr:PREDICTED: uncharacterized protein LOC103365025 [Stegastes partitus]